MVIKKLIPVIAAMAIGIAAAPAQAASGHWCRQGDPPIQTSAQTSCAFAARALDAYYQGQRGAAYIYSPVTHRVYRVKYRARWIGRYTQMVTATGSNGIWLRFRHGL